MFITDDTTTEVIANLANVQCIVMETMLRTIEDFDELQPGLELLISSQKELTIALDASKRADDEMEKFISKIRIETADEYCPDCADQASIAAPGQTIYCRSHQG
jgi:hypothetical protein